MSVSANNTYDICPAFADPPRYACHRAEQQSGRADSASRRLIETVTLGVQVEVEVPGQIELAVDLRQMISQCVFAHSEQVGNHSMARACRTPEGNDDVALAQS